MKIISILNNPYTQRDFALYLKDNHSDEGLVSPAVNTDNIISTKPGMSILQVEFWSNDKIRPYKFLGEQLSVVVDDDSDFRKKGCPWPEFMEVYESW